MPLAGCSATWVGAPAKARSRPGRPARLAAALAAALVLPLLAAQPVDDEGAPRHGSPPDDAVDAEAGAYPAAGADPEAGADPDAHADPAAAADAASRADPEADADADAASRDPGIALPDGPGRALVLSACMPCHNLAGIAAFKGYWNREQWAAMVATMIGHGAKLDAAETEAVVAYLTAHFGVTEHQRERGMADDQTDTAR